MDFQQVVRRRHMVRQLRSDPVDALVLQRILDNARHGPSAGFSQGQAFLVLRDAELAAFWRFAEHVADGVKGAPLVIVPFSCKRIYLDRYAEPDKGWTDRAESRWPVPFWHIDTGMATLLILQTVVDAGLGALYFGITPDQVDAFRAAYGIPEDHEPIGAVAIGHPAETAVLDRSDRRRSLADVVHYGRW